MNSASNWIIYCYLRKRFVNQIFLRRNCRKKYEPRKLKCLKDLDSDENETTECLSAAPHIAAMTGRQSYFIAFYKDSRIVGIFVAIIDIGLLMYI